MGEGVWKEVEGWETQGGQRRLPWQPIAALIVRYSVKQNNQAKYGRYEVGARLGSGGAVFMMGEACQVPGWYCPLSLPGDPGGAFPCVT